MKYRLVIVINCAIVTQVCCMQEAFVVQLDKTPQLLSVNQWMALNIPVADEHYKAMMEHAPTIAASKKTLDCNEVVKQLFALQEQAYHKTVDTQFFRNKCILWGSYLWSVAAIGITVFIGGYGMKCGLNK